ncbi:unnamed protein product [Orchesella dallaii]|uniref:RRM domain-containing protein n=1 Tax=Orchesella dallaii TaxID=48710 RepID=A0ABP1R076_9HEXA
MAKKNPFKDIPIVANPNRFPIGTEELVDDSDLGENGLMIRSPGEFALDDPELLHRELGLLALHGEAENCHERLSKLGERTGMPITQENGQRCYGPPLDPNIPVPERGSEVFVGKLPRHCYEPDLVPVFEKVGRIYELRLMMDFSGTNRGYCFVLYFTPAEAERAVKELNNYQIQPGKHIGVVKSVDNCRLFLGCIRKDKDEEEIRQEMENVTEGVVKVIVHEPTEANPFAKNRGYAFIEYESHKAAAMARRKLVPGNIKMWGADVYVDWAEPELGIHTLFVKNLSPSTSGESLQHLFNTVSDNGVLKVTRTNKDYAFVDFRTRNEAQMAMAALNGARVENYEIRVSWHKDRSKIQKKGCKVRIEFDTKTPSKFEHRRDNHKQEANVGRSRNEVVQQGQKNNDHHFQPGRQWQNQMHATLGESKKDKSQMNGLGSSSYSSRPNYFQGYQTSGYINANEYQNPYKSQFQTQPMWNKAVGSPVISSPNPYCTEYSPFFQYNVQCYNYAGYNGNGFRSVDSQGPAYSTADLVHPFGRFK